MDQWEQAIVDLAGSVLKQTRPYQEKAEYDEVPPEENFQVSYILTKGDLSAPENILAIAACEDETFLFYPLKPRGEPIADWPPVSDHETMLFGTLTEGFDLMMMTPDTHYNVWSLISYSGLIPGKQYRISGVLMDKETGEKLLVDGKEVTSEVEFTPETPDGAEEIPFTFNASTLAGKSIVVFETLYQENVEVPGHQPDGENHHGTGL